MFILGNTAYATTKSNQHCFLGAQTGKHLLRKQNVSEKKSEAIFVSWKQKMFPQQMFRLRANRETFSETCFLNNVSSFSGALTATKRSRRTSQVLIV